MNRFLAAVSYVDADGRREAHVGVDPRNWRGLWSSWLLALEADRVGARQLVADNLPRAEEDIAKLRQSLPKRRETLQHLNQKYPRVLARKQQSRSRPKRACRLRSIR